MKKSAEKTSVKKSSSKKSKLEEWFINILAIVLLGGGMVFIVFMTANNTAHNDDGNDSYLASLPAPGDTIAHNKICMVDDIYQGDYPTLNLSLTGKRYFGCDAKAIQSLSIEPNLRSAIDPFTNRKVDKASAVIAISPKRDGKVLYFESMQTFNQYLRALPRQ